MLLQFPSGWQNFPSFQLHYVPFSLEFFSVVRTSRESFCTFWSAFLVKFSRVVVDGEKNQFLVYPEGASVMLKAKYHLVGKNDDKDVWGLD